MLTTLSLAGCVTSGSSREVVTRSLPGPPSYLNPVAVPDPRAGESLITIAARERAGRLKANGIITSARGQWSALQKTYARKR